MTVKERRYKGGGGEEEDVDVICSFVLKMWMFELEGGVTEGQLVLYRLEPSHRVQRNLQLKQQ